MGFRAQKARSKTQGAESREQEARCRKQDAGCGKQETENRKQDAGAQKAGRRVREAVTKKIDRKFWMTYNELKEKRRFSI